MSSYLHAAAGGARLVMRELGERHEADALIGILLKHGDLVRRATAVRLAAHHFAKIGDLVPGSNAARHRFEQVGVLVHHRLLGERGDASVGAPAAGTTSLASWSRPSAPPG